MFWRGPEDIFILNFSCLTFLLLKLYSNYYIQEPQRTGINWNELHPVSCTCINCCILILIIVFCIPSLLCANIFNILYPFFSVINGGQYFPPPLLLLVRNMGKKHPRWESYWYLCKMLCDTTVCHPDRFMGLFHLCHVFRVYRYRYLGVIAVEVIPKRDLSNIT